MFLALAILLIVWFTEIPLWVSIICTVFAGITIIIKFFAGFLEGFAKNDDGDNSHEK